MKVESFLICDAATDSAGKLSVLGGFDTILAREVPVIHSRCAVAIRTRYSRIESGQHTLRLKIIDEDGVELLPAVEGEVNVRLSEGSYSAASNLILDITGLKLPRFGQYAIDLAIDGRQEATIPLFVKQKSPTLQANEELEGSSQGSEH